MLSVRVRIHCVVFPFGAFPLGMVDFDDPAEIDQEFSSKSVMPALRIFPSWLNVNLGWNA